MRKALNQNGVCSFSQFAASGYHISQEVNGMSSVPSLAESQHDTVIGDGIGPDAQFFHLMEESDCFINFPFSAKPRLETLSSHLIQKFYSRFCPPCLCKPINHNVELHCLLNSTFLTSCIDQTRVCEQNLPLQLPIKNLHCLLPSPNQTMKVIIALDFIIAGMNRTQRWAITIGAPLMERSPTIDCKRFILGNSANTILPVSSILKFLLQFNR
ncbi:hypothetical protein Cgig2_008387 [Carnegiea gigantea]|uniref:Uncharacterized protein n=1 Tax=Carnegiea gigantea TaxID=171969 RepID=A0A9Q1Q5T4_9CARY|nr:hypothetical protein Cgig2_008387 [Carnegiea gigantea]